MKYILYLPAFFGLLFTSSLLHADFEIERVGFQFGIDAENHAQLESYEIVALVETPWEWDLSEKIELELSLEGTAGALTGQGETSGLLHLGLFLEMEIDDWPISFFGSSGPTLLTEDEFGALDLGGNLQFTSSIGLQAEIGDKWTVGYRYQHISNAGIEDQNPGLNMHALFTNFEF